MSRRGGKRRQVLQLGDTSKLHRYGYSKGFQSMEGSVQGNPLTALVGDYSDSDSDDNSNSDPKPAGIQQIPEKDEQHIDSPLSAVQDPSTNQQNCDKEEDPMDNELRNFLSEIEAIPMPDESKTPERLSEGGPSPTPSDQGVAALDNEQGKTTTEESKTATAAGGGGSKKKNAYSMFVKGDVEFAHSPSPTPPPPTASLEQQQALSTEDSYKEKTPQSAANATSTTTSAAALDFADIPVEPTTRWQMVQDEATQYYYYWNWQTNAVTWEIPSDYTQYLLLHKEYKEKLAKIPPHILQAWKDRKSGKDKDAGDGNSLKGAKVNWSSVTAATAALKKTDLNGKEKKHEEDDDKCSSYHHHKKKKSKKHKRRYNSSSDDDLDSKYLRDDDTSSSKKSSKKSKTPIGPQPLSIVPYMSDDNDEYSDNDDDGEKDSRKTVENVMSNPEACSEASPAPEVNNSDKSKSSSISPVPVSDSKGDLSSDKNTAADFESLVQNLVEFHDNITAFGTWGQDGDHDDKSDERLATNGVNKETKAVVDESKVETNEINHGAIKEELDGDENGGEKLTSAALPGKEESETTFLKEKERQNIFDQFSTAKESEKSKKLKKKKKIINMFAEDSHSEIDEDSDNKMETNEPSGVAVKSEIIESEISDSDSKGFGNKKENIVHSDVKSDAIQDSKQVGSFKSIVGYSEEDEKEVKEEGKDAEKVKDSSEKSDTTSSIQPKKKVLQYKDYMKKYRSDKVTSKDKEETSNNKESTTTGSVLVHSADEPVKSRYEETDSPKEKDGSQPVTTSHEEEKVVKQEAEEEKKTETDGDDSEEDLDLDDLDNIDRVLEKALEKKRENKTEKESKAETDEKTDEAPPESSHEASSSLAVETKQTEEKDRGENVEPSVKDSTMSDTDMKRLKYAVKDSAELALNKLQFLDISTKNMSKLQILLVELQTRYNDWQSGGLSTPYFHKQLKSSEALLSQYEESAVPSGWSCQWDRASCRYFYRNENNGHTQWEYPQVTSSSEPSSSTTTTATTTTTSSKSGDPKESSTTTSSSSNRGRSSKKRRSKDKEEREESGSKTRGHNSTSSRSSRSHRSSKKGSEKDRGKRDRRSGSSHHHRKKKRRRRDHSSSSSSSEEESTSHSHHRHSRSKRKKRGRSDKSPSLEVIDCDDPGINTVQVIDDSPPRSERAALGKAGEDKTGNGDVESSKETASSRPSATLGLIADYGSEQDPDEENNDDRGGKKMDGDSDKSIDDDVSELEKRKKEMEAELEGIDGEEMEEEETEERVREMQAAGDEETKEKEDEEEKEDVQSNAVIIKPPQIIVPPYVAAMNQPQLYSAPALYTSAPVPSSTTAVPPATVAADQDYEQGGEMAATVAVAGAATAASEDQAQEDNDKAASKKKKKDKSGKEKSLMKKKRVSSMVQKWQQVKKEVEKENRDKELRQAAIREKINQLKST